MLAEEALLAGLFPFPRLRLQRGAQSYVWDTAGRRYLDFTSGLGVAALGHGREDLAAIAHQQFRTLAHCSNLFVHEPALQLAHGLLGTAPWARRVWLANSGTEATEAALKFARLVGRARGGAAKHVTVAFHHGFHGRTMGALAVTGEAAYREPFEPMLPGIRFVPFDDLAAAEAAIDASVCAVLVEPVQGEGGVHVASSAFLRGLRARCDAVGALLIMDEVQCGLGRLGHLYAHHIYGVEPDMMCLAKPLAGGLPLSAVLINDVVAQALRPGHHGSTFGGSPVACAVAVAVLAELSAPAFLRQVQHRGAHLAERLAAVARAHPGLWDGVRGLGLMQALVVRDPSRHPLGDLVRAAQKRGLLITRAGHDALRLLPPLNCTAAEIEEAADVLAALAAEAP